MISATENTEGVSWYRSNNAIILTTTIDDLVLSIIIIHHSLPPRDRMPRPDSPRRGAAD